MIRTGAQGGGLGWEQGGATGGNHDLGREGQGNQEVHSVAACLELNSHPATWSF